MFILSPNIWYVCQPCQKRNQKLHGFRIEHTLSISKSDFRAGIKISWNQIYFGALQIRENLQTPLMRISYMIYFWSPRQLYRRAWPRRDPTTCFTPFCVLSAPSLSTGSGAPRWSERPVIWWSSGGPSFLWPWPY